MTGQPNAADVLADHPVFWLGDYPGGTRCDTCGVLDTSTDQHRVDMLAAAGLLVTPVEVSAWPTDDEVRETFGRQASSPARARLAFGRWLAGHDAQVAARALRERGEAWAQTSAPGGIVDDWGRGWAACRDAVVHDLIERGEAT